MNDIGTYQVYRTLDDWRTQSNSRVYYSRKAAVEVAEALAQAGYTSSVEEVLDYGFGRIIWSSGGKG